MMAMVAGIGGYMLALLFSYILTVGYMQANLQTNPVSLVPAAVAASASQPASNRQAMTAQPEIILHCTIIIVTDALKPLTTL